MKIPLLPNRKGQRSRTMTMVTTILLVNRFPYCRRNFVKGSILGQVTPEIHPNSSFYSNQVEGQIGAREVA